VIVCREVDQEMSRCGPLSFISGLTSSGFRPESRSLSISWIPRIADMETQSTSQIVLIDMQHLVLLF
jgi:hypothetical protein